MVQLKQLTDYLDQTLNISSIPQDKSNNGLQIEGNQEVKKVAGCVDACLETYNRAVADSVDFIFVHHGESWGEGFKYFTGPTAKRFTTLFQNKISLYAAHLPLDAHRILGHNILISNLIGIQNKNWFGKYCDVDIGVFGDLVTSTSTKGLAQLIESKLDTSCCAYDFTGGKIEKVAVISGSGASAIVECQQLGIDCLVTGEMGHSSFHPAKELGVNIITAGHYKTEVPGIIAVLDQIKEKFGLECTFIDIPTNL